jgi:hypothetical protein
VAGPVQGPGSEFWPGHRVARVHSDFFFKSKRCCFSKKKNQRVATGFLTGSPGHPGFWLFLFFLKPSPVLVSGQSDSGSTRRAGSGFKTVTTKYIYIYIYIYIYNNIENDIVIIYVVFILTIKIIGTFFFILTIYSTTFFNIVKTIWHNILNCI